MTLCRGLTGRFGCVSVDLTRRRGCPPGPGGASPFLRPGAPRSADGPPRGRAASSRAPRGHARGRGSSSDCRRRLGDDVEDVDAHGRRRLDAGQDHAHDVALTAPHGELARLERPVLGAHPADAQADHRHPVRVRVVPSQRLAPHLARTVQAGRTQGRLVGQGRPRRRHGIVAAGDDVTDRGLALPPADRGAAAGEDHPRHARPARGLEDLG